MIDNSTLRQNARMQLGESIFGNTWMMLAVLCFVYSAAVGALSGMLIGIIFIGPLSYGMCRVFIGAVNGKKLDFNDALSGFTEALGNSLVLELLRTLFTALWSMLFVVPGIVKSYSYAMAMYIQQDDPDLDARDCIDTSREMMDGYKWKLFCLDCSFIGWYLLGALCFGIGVFFVMPYHETAKANFYLALKAERMNLFTSSN